MSIIDFSSNLSSAINPGTVVDGNVVRIVADNGAEIGDGVYKVINGGNGTASEVAVATQTGAGGTVATGLAYLTVQLQTAVAAIAPALGVVASGVIVGVAWYNIAPEFWTNLSNRLFNMGKTIGGEPIAYWSGDNIYFDDATIETVKEALIEAGVFNNNYDWDEEQPESWNVIPPVNASNTTFAAGVGSSRRNYYYVGRLDFTYGVVTTGFKVNEFHNDMKCTSLLDAGGYLHAIISSKTAFSAGLDGFYESDGSLAMSSGATPAQRYTYNNQTVYYYYQITTALGISSNGTNRENLDDPTNIAKIAWLMQYGNFTLDEVAPLQGGAIYPNSMDDIATTYPNWQPYPYDPTLPDVPELPTIYPLKYPDVDPIPKPNQEEAQEAGDEDEEEIYEKIIPQFPLPIPGIVPIPPEPIIDPDPDEEEKDPLPEDESAEEKDPVNPNPPPRPTPIIPPGNLPSTVTSNKLFTVYNPSSSQLDQLGGYLWDASLIATLRDIWQDPLDGIISLQQVYVTPTTSGNNNIMLGYLDTGISAPVVSSQFVTVDCGSVAVNEDKKNATDYAPYTSLHLYLPFIGIVELDTNECMKSSINVKYKVDVYTGTCLAEVKITRTEDMPNGPIIYTFSGNCSQQLPLTSGNATGLLNALIGAVTAGMSAASGGGLSTLAGAQMLGNSLTHEMFHVNHSGNISANAGIMGQKKPYLIIGRRHCYDANNYNAYYGYPSNKTLIMGNHHGFLRVKKCWIKTSALQDEYDEIMRLLEEGVFM